MFCDAPPPSPPPPPHPELPHPKLTWYLQDADLYGHGGHSPAFVPTFGSVLPTDMVSYAGEIMMHQLSIQSTTCSYLLLLRRLSVTCCPALPCPALPCPALPCPALSFASICIPCLGTAQIHAACVHMEMHCLFSWHGQVFTDVLRRLAARIYI